MTNRIKPNQLAIIFKLNKIFPECYLTGSVALVLLNIINRNSNNIDICIPLESKNNTLHKLKQLKIEYKEEKENKYALTTKSSTSRFSGGTATFEPIGGYCYNNYSYSIMLNRCKVNIFFTTNEKTFQFSLDGISIKIADPFQIFLAKQNYVNISHYNWSDNIRKMVKMHEDDFNAYSINKNQWKRTIKLSHIL